jgi:hypothetical protein
MARDEASALMTTQVTWDGVRALSGDAAREMIALTATLGRALRVVRVAGMLLAMLTAAAFAAALPFPSGPVLGVAAASVFVLGAAVVGPAARWTVRRWVHRARLDTEEAQAVAGVFYTSVHRGRLRTLRLLLADPPGELSCAAVGRHIAVFCPHRRSEQGTARHP